MVGAALPGVDGGAPLGSLDLQGNVFDFVPARRSALGTAPEGSDVALHPSWTSQVAAGEAQPGRWGCYYGRRQRGPAPTDAGSL